MFLSDNRAAPLITALRALRPGSTAPRPSRPSPRAAHHPAPTPPPHPPQGDGGGPSGPLTVIPTDYRIGATLLAVALFLGPVCHLWTQFLLHGALGGFLSFQASRLRFRFSETDLDLVFIEPLGDDSQALTADAASSGDNKLQGGGLNKWSLKSVTNWEFWWPGFPVLVYFKETQTRPEGARGLRCPTALPPESPPARCSPLMGCVCCACFYIAAAGQPHFFPIILNGKRLYEEMLVRSESPLFSVRFRGGGRL